METKWKFTGFFMWLNIIATSIWYLMTGFDYFLRDYYSTSTLYRKYSKNCKKLQKYRE